MVIRRTYDRDRGTLVRQIAGTIFNREFWKDDAGQDLIEYALMAGMVAVAAVASMPPLAATMSSVFSKIGSIITANVQ